MTNREIALIRRSMKFGKSTIKMIYGYYVSSTGETIAKFSKSTSALSDAETIKFLDLLNAGLSGKFGKTLHNATVRTSDDDAVKLHAAMLELSESLCQADDSRSLFFESIQSTYSSEDNYLILLAGDSIDIPHNINEVYTSGKKKRLNHKNADMLDYVICVICPVKEKDRDVIYDNSDHDFILSNENLTVKPPHIAMLFPALNNNSIDTCGAVYVTKDKKNSQKSLYAAFFEELPPLSASEQHFGFLSALETISDDEKSSILQGAVSAMVGRIEAQHADNPQAPVLLTQEKLKTLLEEAGASDEAVERAAESFESYFGENGKASAEICVGDKITFTAGGVAVSFPSDSGIHVDIKEIDGKKCLIVPVGSHSVCINGIKVG